MDEREQLRGYLADYLRQRGISLRKSFRCLSPEHEDKHPSMSYNSRSERVHCFACGVTYDIFDVVGIDYHIPDFPGQYRQVCSLFGEPEKLCPVRRTKNEDKPSPAPQSRDRELEQLQQSSEGGRDYFLGRGITTESCEKYGLFQKSGRAYFPVYEGGVCTGWCARSMDDDIQPRYKNSSGALGLWNGDLLHSSERGGRLFVTEGIVDAICLEQMGESAVALCGSQNTGKLLRRCENNLSAANGWKFILCGDPDEAGRKMNQTLRDGLERLGIGCAELSLGSEDGDIAALYRRDRQRLEALLATESVEKAESSSGYNAGSTAASMDAFFAESERRAAKGAIPTGFSSLDKLLDGGLYPGLYVIGAISSLGKTSLVLQIADTIAENSADVLFFSLEQSKYELMAKSLSRTSAMLAGHEEPFTARHLLSGQAIDTLGRRQLLQDCREAYAQAAAGLFIREGIADIGAAEIRNAVREHIQHRGTAPVVVVDYLQILCPADPRSTDKQNTDRAVVELKRISRDFDTPVIAISSFNRENYKAAVTMEAFKESGAVEYSSDVLLGLQLQGVGDKDFDVNKEKARNPRRLELVLLKNRSGIPYAKLPFSYDARFSLFADRRVDLGTLSQTLPKGQMAPSPA